MVEDKRIPESIEDVKKQVFRGIWIWISKKSLGLKIVFCVLFVIILFSLSRINIFGEPYYGYSKLIFPVNITGVDPVHSVIPLSLSYEIQGHMGRRTGKLGDVCYDEDYIYLYFAAGKNCWVSVFCVDSKGIHPVFRKELSPNYVEKDETYTIDFELDETIGTEIYYAIAAYEKFSFEEDIKPYLDQVFSQGNSKGPAFSRYELKLPKMFTQKLIYFKHLARE